jgi:hypothetical protein
LLAKDNDSTLKLFFGGFAKTRELENSEKEGFSRELGIQKKNPIKFCALEKQQKR